MSAFSCTLSLLRPPVGMTPLQHRSQLGAEAAGRSGNVLVTATQQVASLLTKSAVYTTLYTTALQPLTTGVGSAVLASEVLEEQACRRALVQAVGLWRRSVTYWLDLFTGTTWEEFRKAGASVTGFRSRMRSHAAKVRPGDVFLCYLTGVKHWVGALEVIGSSEDETRIWEQAEFPVRFDVRPLVMLDPEHGVPMDDLEGRVSFYQDGSDRGKYKGFVRMSPNRFREPQDAEIVFNALLQAEKSPVAKPIDPRKLHRLPTYGVVRRRGKKSVPTVVTVPESEENVDTTTTAEAAGREEQATTSLHTEMEYILLKLGADMGLDVWVARNDRGKMCNGCTLGSMPGMLADIPTQFNDATNRTVELIDVLWLRGNSIVAAFEVEHTTSIYSGLLRMSDLVALQPNLDIKLYLVAPDDRREKVAQEIRRPTFTLRERPLPEICGFISFTTLSEKVEGIQRLGLAASLKPDFLESTAEYFTTADG